jgi:hypothetical protein
MSGWDLTSCVNAKLPSYDALMDPNMRHFFENRSVQKHLYSSGQIDRAGRVIDLERGRNKSKLQIIDQEFKAAERMEYWRQKEEEEMRYRVQKKRHQALDRARQQEKLMKMKDDRRIRQEIVLATRESYGIKYPGGSRPSAALSNPAHGDSIDVLRSGLA